MDPKIFILFRPSHCRDLLDAWLALTSLPDDAFERATRSGLADQCANVVEAIVPTEWLLTGRLGTLDLHLSDERALVLVALWRACVAEKCVIADRLGDLVLETIPVRLLAA